MTRRDGAHPLLWEFVAQANFDNMPQPLQDAFLKVKPDPRQLRTRQEKDAVRIRNFTDMPDAQLARLQAETLIGDRDTVNPEHALALTRLIPRARLLVLVGGHGDYLGEAVMAQRKSDYPALTAGLIEDVFDAHRQE